MRILILTQWFDPEPAVKGLLFARALRRAGHDVHVITGFPNYPGGRVYPGYRIRPVTRERIDGIVVTRVALFPSHDRSTIRRVLNYLTFAASATIAGLLTRFRADVMYVYHPPLTVGIAAAIIGAVRRIPFVYDVQDLWPDTLEATGMMRNRRVLSIVGRVADWVYSQARVVIAQSPGFRSRIAARGVPDDRLELIYNWCDEDALGTPQGDPPDLATLAGRFNVVFAGTMGKGQALDAVLDAAAVVHREDPRVQFVFVGGGTEVARLRDRAAEIAPSNVVFLPRQSMQEVRHTLAAADALLVHLSDSPLFAITVPSKTQAYLHAGKPILMGAAGDGAALVREAAAGTLARPQDAASIAAAVLELARLPAAERSAMGARGRAFYDANLSLAIGTRKMIGVFERARAST